MARSVDASVGVDDVVTVRTECDPVYGFVGIPDLPDFRVGEFSCG